jgi:hypothetical protein
MASFGKKESLRCIADIELQGPQGEDLCLAHKFTTKAFLLPAYLTDDGYVLKIEGQDSYYELSPDEMQEWQSEGLLPSPLPSYQIEAVDYLWGYSLWPALILIALWTYVARRRSKTRDALSGEPISQEPPTIVTEGDRYIQQQVAPLLREGEAVSHQAHAPSKRLQGMSSATAKCHFVCLTNERLIFIKTRNGAFGPLLENHGNESIARADVRDVMVKDIIRFYLADGSERTLWVRKQKQFSNNEAFFRDVPRLLGERHDKQAATGS